MRSIVLPKRERFRKLLPFLLIIMMILTAFSCKQSSIFFNISTENPPKDPKIPGTPSTIVAAKLSADMGLLGNGKLYVTTVKTVWSYDGNAWNKMAHQPDAGGNIVNIASTGGALFIQTAAPDYELWKTEDGAYWVKIPNSGRKLQGIYAAGGELFAAERVSGDVKDPDHAVLWYDGTRLVSLKTIGGSKGLLTGAVHAGSYYYFSTLGGIYALDDSSIEGGALNSVELLPGTTGKGNITGLIADKTGTNLLAVTSDGEILTAEVNGTSTSFTENGYSGMFNGALNIAETGTGKYVLMIGYERGGNVNYGYREVRLNNDGSFPDSISISIQVPGGFVDSTISYSNKSKSEYESSLGKEIVRSIIQTPQEIDLNKTLFASTNGEGLWSYRNGEWNAEE